MSILLNKHVIYIYLTCIGPDDYTSINTDLIFNACDKYSCIDVVIEKDCLVETREEQFSVVLDRGVGMVDAIRLQPAIGHVIIIDNDSKRDVIVRYVCLDSLFSLSPPPPPPLSSTVAVVELPQDVYYATEGVNDRVYVCPVVRGSNKNFHLELWHPLKAELQVRTIVLTIHGRYYILSIPNLISMQFLD